MKQEKNKKVTHEKITAVIPALNEQETIRKVVKSVSAVANEVIVVNDGSTDNTKAEAQAAGALVVDNSRTEGYDTSLNRGASMAFERGARIVFTFDGDGQHHASDAKKLVALLKKEKADIAIGIRPHKQRWSEHLLAWYTTRKVGIHDPLCGLKAYQQKVYAANNFIDSIKSIGTELAVRAALDGAKIVQQHISMRTRKDTPRFGRRMKANAKIVQALMRLVRRYGL